MQSFILIHYLCCIEFQFITAMKKFILLGIMAGALLACSKDDKGSSTLDPNAKLALNGATAVKSEANPEHLSIREIVERASAINFVTDQYGETGRGFADTQRDLENNRLLMYGSDIIEPHEGGLNPFFIKAWDNVIVCRTYFPGQTDPVGRPLSILDTIAYLPNSEFKAAYEAVMKAYNAGDFKEVYRLFQNAYTFYPITGAEWRALKAQGKQ